MTIENPTEGYMRRAIELSARGYPAPNPRVGCVIVSGGKVVGEGWHEAAGEAHAESVALSAAGERARGSDVFVTLEPCNHHGRTGPCAAALVEAGVARVFYACDDPNPAAGGGAAALKKAGIAVQGGVLAQEASRANEAFLAAHSRGYPFVVVKAAISLDGRIGLPSGESKWITGEAAREEGQKLRAEMGCVLIGAGAARCDDPSLTVRLPGVRNQPLRVVLDPLGALDPSLRLFDSSAPTLHVVARAGRANQLELPLEAGRFDTRALLRALYERGVTGVLVEGGAMTIARFIEQRTVDVIELFIAPKLLGSGPSWCEVPGLDKLENAMTMAIEQVAMIGEDLRVRLRPR